MSKVRAIYHLVFATKERRQTITPEYRKELYAYLYGILKNNGCYVHRINGMAEHLHILFDLTPSRSLADLVRDLRQSSSVWLKSNEHFPHFDAWCRGYYAVTIGIHDIESVTGYIIHQQEHHQSCGFIQEMEAIASRNGLQWHPSDFM